ncbi:hypothetical protein [Dysgonomonas sp. Marseille-P4361]|uniref:hypothetical protein n=1 Tax=Dysgonomonas sp. Marseille-P4361 TaxID=2161820 RepID=UPI000D55F75E|nr:hypothetical protein [Dysgonomonas sp. Marseille-P4361]
MKNLTLIFFLILCCCGQLLSQQIYDIYDFTDRYGLFFTASDTVEQDASAYFRLYDRATDEIILSAGDDEMKEYVNSAPVLKISKDVLQPKRFFFTDDYNFDDKPDLCVLDREIYDEGCYYPSQQQFFYLSSNDKFLFDEELTSLYADCTCYRGGFVEPKADKKLLLSGSSGGAAYHSYNYHKWVDGSLKIVDSFTEDGFKNPIYYLVEGSRFNEDGTSEEYAYKYLDTDYHKPIFSFETQNGKGRAVLFVYEGNLYYAFQQEDDKIYFAYPDHPDKAAMKTFNYSVNNSPKTAQLSFDSGTVNYTIQNQKTDVGEEKALITITVNGKKTVWQGKPSTINGSLFDIQPKEKKLGNVSDEP